MYQCNCGKSFEKMGSLRTHARFCKKYEKQQKPNSKYKVDTGYLCECGRIFEKSQSLNSHFSHCLVHRNGVPVNRKVPAYCGWNLGKTKHSSDSIKRGADSLKRGYVSGRLIPGFKGKTFSEEQKRNLSLKAINRLQNDESHCKWFAVFNGKDFIKVQGTWEKRVAERLTSLDEYWIREKVPYGKTKHYLPDFFLPHRNLYIEVKGWWKNRDLNKMNLVLTENEIDLRIIDSLSEIESFENGALSIINLRKFENTPT